MLKFCWPKNYYIYWVQLLGFSLLVCLAPSAAFALKGDETKPVQIEADQATLDQKQMETVFTGKVVITRGSILIHADKGVADQNPNGDKTVKLFGDPVTFQQTMDDGKLVAGQANRFDYATQTNLAILTGRARIKKGNDMVTGSKITYNTKTQVYSVNSMPANGINKAKLGRVTVILDQAEHDSK